MAAPLYASGGTEGAVVAKQTLRLQGNQADATMGNTRYSTKEEREDGRTREESREEFRQR